ncbi:hypothetical protein JM93_00982 [Roseibium hamelinense]|uniref:Uncharacterized protein n=1 Tax=Roseibium hamelinense TaxID=150831 RepID=A0A562TIF2_9HYPH|nr:hypothetical protein [Roseibium hamelinense]MTI42777.1 hypothetical protein [Roseibium hamelinense]TWI93425.1 hypothetical protein JM93_00982 [Roseibium hamelinense]
MSEPEPTEKKLTAGSATKPQKGAGKIASVSEGTAASSSDPLRSLKNGAFQHKGKPDRPTGFPQFKTARHSTTGTASLPSGQKAQPAPGQQHRQVFTGKMPEFSESSGKEGPFAPRPGTQGGSPHKAGSDSFTSQGEHLPEQITIDMRQLRRVIQLLVLLSGGGK